MKGVKSMSEYEGKENLDIMSLALNYNSAIYRWILEDESLKGKRVLDFGSGKGEFCNRFEEGVYAVELDTTMHTHLECPSKQSIKEFDKKFDLIYSSNVLEHIENDSETIEELYNSLKSGGHIKVLVPAQMELYSEMDRAVGHYRRYRKKELIDKFEKVGFHVEYCKYFDFLGYFAALTYKLISNKAEISSSSLVTYDRYVFPISSFIDRITFGKIIGKNILLKAVKS